MKITYRREMKHNYMIVDPESLTWRNYECRMLAANSIDGVLHFQIRQVDDEIRFYYEITSRQPLNRILESQSVRSKELHSLVFGISRVLDRMEQYLLREGSVLLEPEYIYVEPENFRVWLCLIPGLERDFPEDYGKLLEYLLGKVDHQDKDSVVLAYGLYQETRKENYGMEDILCLFRAEQGKPEKQEIKEKQMREAQTQEVFFDAVSRSVPKIASGDRQEKKHPPAKKKPTLWNRLSQWWKQRKREKEPPVVQVPWDMMFHEEYENERADTEAYPGPASVSPAPVGPASVGQAPVGQAPMGQAPVGPAGRAGTTQVKSVAERDRTSEASQPGQDTVLLTDLSLGAADSHAKLHCLRSLDGEAADIPISYYPFIIGKQENLVDFLLPYDTVSRLHLRIDREGSRFFVQDLNSTNGTTVSGHLLENNESAELHEGEEIHIARYRYRFE